MSSDKQPAQALAQPAKCCNEQPYADPVDLELPSLGITIPHAEIFARD